jgi:N-sulfoglucosamine sulfohydrolase
MKQFLFVLMIGFVAATFTHAATRPNIVWIVADDLSPELGCYGYEHVKTPNLDRLAKEGARFTRAFSAAPVCSSSRSAFITGMHQTSIACQHHRTEDPRPLPVAVKPLPELLRAEGYFVTNSQDPDGKKWGKTDYNFVYEARQMYDAPDWRKRKPGQPFFAQVQIKEPHRAFVNEPVTGARHLSAPLPPIYADHPLARRDWQAYLQSIEALDAKVGRVLAALDAEGVAQNTVVMFFGDHGRPHVRDKQWLYDGGLRVPLLVRWPGKIPAGSVREELVSLIDLAPTCLRIVGADVPGIMQGVSVFPAQSPRREFVVGARDRCGDADDRIRSVRTERFNYIRNFHPELPYTQHSSYKEVQYPMLPLMRQLHAEGKLTPVQAAFYAKTKPAEELYDVVNDPWETRNLANDPAHAATLRDLRAMLDRWMKDTVDRGGTPETNPTLETVVNQTRKTTYEKPLKARGLSAQPTDAQMIEWWEKEYRK